MLLHNSIGIAQRRIFCIVTYKRLLVLADVRPRRLEPVGGCGNQLSAVWLGYTNNADVKLLVDVH